MASYSENAQKVNAQVQLRPGSAHKQRVKEQCIVLAGLSLIHFDLRVGLSWVQTFYLLFNSKYNAITVLNYSEAEFFAPLFK